MDIKTAITFEDLVTEFSKRSGMNYWDSEKLFEDSYLNPDGCKPACFGKYTMNKKGLAREFMSDLLNELKVERIYIVYEI